MRSRPISRVRTVARAASVVAFHPSLWATALRELGHFTPRRWWSRSPFLPLPDPALLRFRMVTAYGDPDAGFTTEDLLTWLRWCRSWHREHR